MELDDPLTTLFLSWKFDKLGTYDFFSHTEYRHAEYRLNYASIKPVMLGIVILSVLAQYNTDAVY